MSNCAHPARLRTDESISPVDRTRFSQQYVRKIRQRDAAQVLAPAFVGFPYDGSDSVVLPSQ